MSLRHGLLGLLAEGPASGYDLARRFEDLLGAIWPAKHPQIYGELIRLAGAGHIAAAAEGPRRRKEYRITDTGRAELHRWLVEAPVDHSVRLEPLLRSLFFWTISPEELTDHLDREAAHWRETAARYRCHAAAADQDDGPRARAARVTAEAGVRLYEALADWAEWAKQAPPGR
ncbi:PadR family transcriptional regulator [Actinophytocola sp. NPDC049390]|uniref:PadR family transcriptional regulator n=1 Tax=Actinophytocola sp. NPDC049390 TaxID=3363894 RepID=UPI0037A08A8C